MAGGAGGTEGVKARAARADSHRRLRLARQRPHIRSFGSWLWSGDARCRGAGAEAGLRRLRRFGVRLINKAGPFRLAVPIEPLVFLVRMIGLEPTLPRGNWNLNPARLPISPHPHALREL